MTGKIRNAFEGVLDQMKRMGGVWREGQDPLADRHLELMMLFAKLGRNMPQELLNELRLVQGMMKSTPAPRTHYGQQPRCEMCRDAGYIPVHRGEYSGVKDCTCAARRPEKRDDHEKPKRERKTRYPDE
jgi:hypothetical protein